MEHNFEAEWPFVCEKNFTFFGLSMFTISHIKDTQVMFCFSSKGLPTSGMVALWESLWFPSFVPTQSEPIALVNSSSQQPYALRQCGIIVELPGNVFSMVWDHQNAPVFCSLLPCAWDQRGNRLSTTLWGLLYSSLKLFPELQFVGRSVRPHSMTPRCVNGTVIYFGHLPLAWHSCSHATK